MNLPRLCGFATIYTHYQIREIADLLGQALEISFEPYVYRGDREDMEEFESDMTSHWFIMGLYLSATEPKGVEPRSVTLSLNMDYAGWWSRLGLNLETDLPPIKICPFLAAILRKETALPFVARPISNFWYGGQKLRTPPVYAIPKLEGSWVFQTRVSLTDIALELNQKTKINLQRIPNQSIYRATGFGHRVELRESQADDKALLRTVTLSLYPNYDLLSLGLNSSEYQNINVPMVDTIQAYLQQMAKVAFVET